MRFAPEAAHGANNGLNIARNVMEKVKEEFPWISYGVLHAFSSAYPSPLIRTHF